MALPAPLNMNAWFDGANRVATSRHHYLLDPRSAIRTNNGAGHGLFIESLTGVNGNEQPPQTTDEAGRYTQWMLLISTTSAEICGTPQRTTTGSLDLRMEYQEAFDDGASRPLLWLIWFRRKGRLNCTTSLSWWVTIFHGFRNLKSQSRSKPSQA